MRVKPRARRISIDGSTVSTPRQPGSAPPGSRVPLCPAGTAAGSPAADQWHPGDAATLSATLAAADGTIVATVTRHTEPADSAAGHDDPLLVVTVAGDVDLDTASLLRTTLTQAIDRHPRVCCDLSQVEFFGAVGAHLLLEARRHALDAGHDFGVRGVHGMTDRVLRIVGLDEVLLDEV